MVKLCSVTDLEITLNIMYRKIFFLSGLILACSFCFAQKQMVYKQIDTISLIMEVHYPPQMDTTKEYPAIVFFYGGGWKGGSIEQFKQHSIYLSKRGAICFLADYRVEKRHQTTPYESLKDAKSAIRFIKKNAKKLHVDTSKIVASGGSAGGHLAAAAAIIEGYNEPSDDLTVSCKPAALVLFNPVVDNSPTGYGYDRIGEEYKNFSPLHNIKTGAPPTIMFLGTNDICLSVEAAKNFKKEMEDVGSKCELKLYEGEKHGFFNYNRSFEYYKKTLLEADEFLISLGYLKKEPVVEIE